MYEIGVLPAANMAASELEPLSLELELGLDDTLLRQEGDDGPVQLLQAAAAAIVEPCGRADGGGQYACGQ